MLAEQTIPNETKWPNTRKILFLFMCCYVVLYILPFPFDSLPYLNIIAEYYTKLTDPIILFFENKIFRIAGFSRVEGTGSGDTGFDYIRIFTILAISVFLTPLLFFIDRKRSNYDKLLYWITVCMRYYVGFAMLIYGFGKIFKSQFGSPDLSKLEQTYGESTPMGLLWTFMGYSNGYCIFTGICEALGGFLLLFRRTTVLGAFIVIAVMANVVALNFFYDVPVKIASSHYLLFCVLILVPNSKPLYDFFMLQKPAKLKYNSISFQTKWKKISFFLLKGTVVVGFTGFAVVETYSFMTQYGDDLPKSPLYGIYRIKVFVQNHDTIPPMLTNYGRWDKLLIDKNSMVKTMNGATFFYDLKIDTTKKTIDFLPQNQGFAVNHFKYIQKKDELYITGNMYTDSIYVEMVRKDIKSMPLLKTGFNWVNEYPNNR